MRTLLCALFFFGLFRKVLGRSCVRVGLRGGLEGSSRDPLLAMREGVLLRNRRDGYSFGKGRGKRGGAGGGRRMRRARACAHRTTESGVHGTRHASRLTARRPDRQPGQPRQPFADRRATDSGLRNKERGANGGPGRLFFYVFLVVVVFFFSNKSARLVSS